MYEKSYLVAIIILSLILIVGGIYVEKSGFNFSSPASLSGLSGGMAPDFVNGDTWLNSPPLTMASLEGKVVLVDFWTYSCINCIRTLPHVTKWYNDYKDNGLVVIGVHTPEFAFEHDTNNVKASLGRFGITYPVVQDNDYAIWNAYNNNYWPADYLIDKSGKIVDTHFGEGDYVATENKIRNLLGLSPITGADQAANLEKIASPEMYFGTDRLANLTPAQAPSVTAKNYTAGGNLSLNNFNLTGSWQFSPVNAELKSSAGEINLKFNSAKLYIVASSANPVTLTPIVDGKAQAPVTVQASQLYTLFDSQDYSEHSVQIKIDGAGLQAFTFTFG